MSSAFSSLYLFKALFTFVAFRCVLRSDYLAIGRRVYAANADVDIAHADR